MLARKASASAAAGAAYPAGKDKAGRRARERPAGTRGLCSGAGGRGSARCPPGPSGAGRGGGTMICPGPGHGGKPAAGQCYLFAQRLPLSPPPRRGADPPPVPPQARDPRRWGAGIWRREAAEIGLAAWGVSRPDGAGGAHPGCAAPWHVPGGGGGVHRGPQGCAGLTSSAHTRGPIPALPAPSAVPRLRAASQGFLRRQNRVWRRQEASPPPPFPSLRAVSQVRPTGLLSSLTVCSPFLCRQGRGQWPPAAVFPGHRSRGIPDGSWDRPAITHRLAAA